MRVDAVRRVSLISAVVAVLGLGPDAWRTVIAEVFSVDPASPLAGLPGGSPANLYRPGPAVYSPAASIGLLPGDDIDAVSFGFDDVASVFPLRFSPDFGTTGAIVAGNAVCSEAGLCPPAVPCPPEPATDVFQTAGAGTASLSYDGDGVPGVGLPLGLTECPAGGPGVQDNVDAFDELQAPLAGTTPIWRIYFSLAPGSPTLGGLNPLLPGGAAPSDILAYDPVHKSLSIFFSGAGLGLAAGDDVDGIAFNSDTSDFLFSLAPGSPSLGNPAICGAGCTPGDFIRSLGPICGATPCNFVLFGSAGLRPLDNVDAVDQKSVVPPYIDRPADDTSPGKTFSLDPSSPILKSIRTPAPIRAGSPADLLVTDRTNPTGAPRVVFRAESLGLLPADDIDGLSFGLEPVYSGGRLAIEFSVDRAATGAAGSAVAVETGAATGSEASADLFSSFLPAGTPPGFVGSNRQEWDGNGTSAQMLHLRDVPLEIPANDHVDALEGAPNFVDLNGDGTRDLRLFFSLAPGSPTLALIGATPGDILSCPAPSCAAPALAITGAALGLAAGDNLEDFALDLATGNVDFTLPPAEAAGLGSDPGAVFRRAGFAPCGAVPCTLFFSPAFGLAPGFFGDNMTGFDPVDPVEACVNISAPAIPGGDPSVKVVSGACPAPVGAGPYDVIEGEIGELQEPAGGVNLSRVVCRASALPVDALTLTSGPDRYQRVRFILARSVGQIDYGISSAGNGRFPSFGGCP